uniref:Uncharacterized protein n=1 Tax=Ciona savignyi TaxID=51511 RepID=H2YGR5_CIOSA
MRAPSAAKSTPLPEPQPRTPPSKERTSAKPTYPDVQIKETTIGDGEETIRRRRRGRRRPQNDVNASNKPTAFANLLAVDCSSTVSRDSGILSAVLEFDELDKTNNNHDRKQSDTIDSTTPTSDDSGYIVDECDVTEECSRSMIVTSHETTEAKQRALSVLQEWVQHFPSDFKNAHLMAALSEA